MHGASASLMLDSANDAMSSIAGLGDDDGIANGTIVDPGALAVANTPAVGDSGGGTIGAGLLSVRVAASLCRRRRPAGN